MKDTIGKPSMSKLSCLTGKLWAENVVFLSIIQNVSDAKVITKGNQCWEIASESMVEIFFSMASHFPF